VSDASEISHGSHSYRLTAETVLGLYTQLRRSGDAKTLKIETRLVQEDGSVFAMRLTTRPTEHGPEVRLTPVTYPDE
jgi:hypothetical protein